MFAGEKPNFLKEADKELKRPPHGVAMVPLGTSRSWCVVYRLAGRLRKGTICVPLKALPRPRRPPRPPTFPTPSASVATLRVLECQRAPPLLSLTSTTPHPPHSPTPQTLTMRQQRVAAERKATNDHLKKIAPYGIVEENLDTLLDRVTAKVAGEAQKVEKKHGQRMVAENMIYEQRLERVEAKLRALEGERKNLTDTVRYCRKRSNRLAHDHCRRRARAETHAHAGRWAGLGPVYSEFAQTWDPNSRGGGGGYPETTRRGVWDTPSHSRLTL